MINERMLANSCAGTALCVDQEVETFRDDRRLIIFVPPREIVANASPTTAASIVATTVVTGAAEILFLTPATISFPKVYNL